MSDELIESVVYLIDSKKGDAGRLSYILSALQEGKPLYNSDKKYLDSLISKHLGTVKRKPGEKSVEELKAELSQVKERLAKFERRGYKKHVGRKAVFFFVTAFFGWHAIITLTSKQFLYNIQDISPYLLPIYFASKYIPDQYMMYVQQFSLTIPKIVVIVWGAMLITWIILGFVYLGKFIRSRHNPNAH